MTSEQWYLLRQPPSFLQRYYCKRPSTTCIPVYWEVFWIYLVDQSRIRTWSGPKAYFHKICIPGIAWYSYVIVALFLQGYQQLVPVPQFGPLNTLRVDRPKTCRYFEERTNRPAMIENTSNRTFISLIVSNVCQISWQSLKLVECVLHCRILPTPCTEQLYKAEYPLRFNRTALSKETPLRQRNTSFHLP